MPKKAEEVKSRPRKERKENADRRRAQLIEATLRSIVERGLNGTTLAAVANEAELSQGVAIFYFQTKENLLAATFEALNQHYADNWQKAIASAPNSPAERLAAMVFSSFKKSVCSRDRLIIWHAFWGEIHSRPQFKEIGERFDQIHFSALMEEIENLLKEIGRDPSEASELATAIDAVTDGLWLQINLSSGVTKPSAALALARKLLSTLFPERTEIFMKA